MCLHISLERIILDREDVMSKMFEIVKKHIDMFDYNSLLKHGAPSDEFDTEVSKICEQISLLDFEEHIAEVIAKVFAASFGCEGKKEMFLCVAKNIYNEFELHQDILLAEETPLAKEMATLIYKQTKDEKFTREMLLFVNNNYKRKQMIQYIKDNNPTLLEINHKSVEIVLLEENYSEEIRRDK